MKRNNAGSSLVEIVAATAIMGILVGAVCTSLMFGLRLNEKTDAQLKAQLAVSSAVETLMAEGIDPAKGTFSNAPKTDSNNNEMTDENGENIYIEKGSLIGYPFSDVVISTIREKIGEDAEFPPYFEVTVTSEIEDVTVTTYIRKAVTES